MNTTADDLSSQDTPTVRYNTVSHPSEVLVKIYRKVEGKIVKDMRRSGRIPEGCSVTTNTASLDQYIENAFHCGTTSYILPANVELGIDVPLNSKRSVVDGGVDRTAGTLAYVSGPAVVTLDHDPNAGSHFTFEKPEKLCEVLVQHFQAAFKGAAHGSYYSSSSFIYYPDGTPYSGAKGHHTAYAVVDALDLLRFSEALFKRLWLLGYGYIMITRSGTMIPRTIFDQKVLEPQQPLFAGGADCRDGITQRRPDPVVCSGGYVNTRAVASLSEEENREFERLVKKAKEERSAEANKVAIAYKKEAVAKLVAKGTSEQRAIRIVESRIGGTLTGVDVLEFDEHGEVTVADVLAVPDKYDKSYLHDPVEPDYGSGSTAIFFANIVTGKPQVYSHAHGGRTFFLKYDEESLTARLNNMTVEDVRQGWLPLVATTDLPADAFERVIKAIAKITGSTLQALRKAVNDYQKEARRTHQGGAPDPSVKLVETLLAERFGNGELLIYTEARQFWQYNGRYWEKIDDAVLRGAIQEMASERWGWVISMLGAQGKQSPPTMASFVASTLEVLKARCIKPDDPLRLMSPRLSVINVANGTLWLEDEGPVLRPHRPEDYLTSCSPLTYDPNAMAPTFEGLVRGMLCREDGTPFDDQDDMYLHVLELLGYVCQGGRFLKVFYVFYGPGDNGKTQLIKVLASILGLDAIAFDRLSGVDEEDSRFAADRLIGKLAVIDDDAPNDYQLPDGFLKKIAEEKPFTAEEKFKAPVGFICQVVPIIATNSLPITSDTSRGMRTRAQVLNFTRQFKRPDEVGPNDPSVQRPDLWRQVFEHELPGVLNLLISGFYRVKERGSFSPPPSARQAFDMWLSNTNVVPRFVAEACEPIDADKFEHTTSMFYDALTDWCKRAENVPERFRPSRNTFKKRLIELGILVKHNNAGSAVFGLRIKAEWKPSAIHHWDDPDKVREALEHEEYADLV
jgi:P4 family phage/plasmid primase-like protien